MFDLANDSRDARGGSAPETGMRARGSGAARPAPDPRSRSPRHAVLSPTDILRREHRLILQGLASVESLEAECRETRRLDPAWARAILSFLQGFVDRVHHAKEEELLFSALGRISSDGAAAAQDGLGDVVASCLAKHRQGRIHLEGMRLALTAVEARSDAAVNRFAVHAILYATILREHIQEEEERAFPRLERILDEPYRRAALVEFAQVDFEAGSAVLDEYHRMPQDLARRRGDGRCAPAPDGGGAARPGGLPVRAL
jgi:hemerythrin-like domain-containing protein